MATKKDLVEAYAFSRRRLVTAFVSGAPGGREVEPTRPGRTIVGGLALAVLLVAGAAIAGIFAPRDPDDWNKPGLIVSKETGANYVILTESEHPVLRPVLNTTSARLMLDSYSAPKVVSQDTIDQQKIGGDLGILGAPNTLPTPSLLIDSGWTACIDDRTGIRVDVTQDDVVRPLTGSGFVVQSKGTYYVIAVGTADVGQTASAYRYELPQEPKNAQQSDQDNLLAELGLPPRASAAHVSDDWLALFPAGGDLDFTSFELTGFGDPVSYGNSGNVPPGARIGDLVTYPLPDGTTQSLLLTDSGPSVIAPFPLGVYRHTRTPDGFVTASSDGSRSGPGPVEFAQDAPPTVTREEPQYAAARWPAGTLEPVNGQECAVLTAESGSAPTVQLATDPTEEASAADLPPGPNPPRVDPGRGAYVLSGDWDSADEGSPFVIDAKGTSYQLVGADAASRLGYGSYPVAVVPDSWVELFVPGVNLSIDDALCPPAATKDQPCS
ncbi:type VII secretion protein EccB [Nocardioides sp. KIGAM211]|uniref:Type VII secretion protein EccB n=1 Tax=Nocardioides luti TaxID=2761101 RepID=A0A7X0VBY6_9ACTN|nr:type VII secretion protein EccB [Nocardioides luti]MBB6627673.1 type VII secretion protein EccB [Nocardioides luti]